MRDDYDIAHIYKDKEKEKLLEQMKNDKKALYSVSSSLSSETDYDY